MESWKIQRDRGKCERSDCPLPTAEEFFAVLELPTCVRKDLCAACFQKLEAASEHRPIYWKACRRDRGKHGPVLDLVSLRLLFERLAEEEGESAAGLRYFVALLLLRKRVLKMADPRNAEQERADLVVVDPKIEGMAPVGLFAPDLGEERLAGLKDELLSAIDEGDEDRAAGG